MELSKLDRRAMSEVARFCHFKDPETGEPMFDGDTAIGAMVKGWQARSVQAVAAEKAKAVLVEGETLSRKTLEDIQRDIVQSAVMLTTEITGVTIDGQPITSAGFERFYDATFFDLDVHMGRKTKRPGSYGQQANAFSAEIASFLTDA